MRLCGNPGNLPAMPGIPIRRAGDVAAFRVSALVSGVAATLPAVLQAQQQQNAIETIEVVGTTPLGAGIDSSRVAGNVQTVSADEMRDQGALDLADFMKRNLGSVFVNDAQSNPLQPDIQYRGFVGSPLLGLPQGLAVYQDGMRINEPFGDTVNWALIPESAIQTVYLMPGSNPLFGQNALGGAISIETKNGFSSPGTRAEMLGGSWGRFSVEAETGGSVNDRLSYFLTASHLEEDGWRDYSPTEARQLFANLGTRSDAGTMDVSLTYAETDLVGNGAAPIDLLETDRSAIFTHPDHTWNELAMLNLRGGRQFGDMIELTGNVYVRSSDIETLNGDDSDVEECEDTPGFLCEFEQEDEEILLDQDGNAIAQDADLQGATVNRTGTVQDSAGVNLQATWQGKFDGRGNQLTVGLSHDGSDVGFDSSTELGSLDATRLAIPGGVFIGDSFVELVADTESTGLFLTNTFSFARAALTVSGRYNRTAVQLVSEEDADLNGDHTFERFNPAVGLTYDLGDALSLYGSYSEASRAPSPVELTCADEDDPCRLPNAFVADPPLEQVVAKTYEAGVRGRWAANRWHVGLFRTTNDDDILFISAGELTNEGFFDNVGETRREGIELNVEGRLGNRVDWSIDYTWLDATFRENFEVTSPNNPASVDSEIEVTNGDQLPLIPNHLLKTGFRITATDKLAFGGELLSSGELRYRGDEGNFVEEIEGYTVLNLRVQYRLGDHAEVFVNIDNVLDEEYGTFGVFGEADEVLGDSFDDPRFLGPGAPRAAWMGLRVSF